MTDIGTQIRDYTHHIVQEVNAEDVFDRTAKAALVTARSSRRRPLLILLASAFVSAVLVGGVVLATRGPAVRDPQPATDRQPPPIVSVRDLTEGWVQVADSADLGLGPEGRLFRVVAAGPGFVAVGVACDTLACVSAMWLSSDGVIWARVADDPFRDGHIFDLTVGGPGVVAVGSTCQFGSPFSGENVEGEAATCSPAVWVSADGVTWVEVQDDQTFEPCTLCDAQINQVVAGSFGLVASGRDHASALWVSADGFTWERADNLEAFGGSWGIDFLTTGGQRVIATGGVCDSAAVCAYATWTTENGTDWTRNDEVEGLGEQGPTALISFGSGGVAVGVGANWTPSAWTSPDWVTWTEAPLPVSGDFDGFEEGSPGTFLQVLALGSELVAFGYDATEGQVVWYTADGHTWTRIADAVGLFAGGVIADVVSADGQLVALVTSPGPSFISKNGANVWMRPDDPEHD